LRKHAANQRFLIVTADDYGMGPETSRGILDLGEQGLVTGTVLLVNAPHAEAGVRLWRQRGMPVELGWHPCLTLDGPVLPPEKVPSLVDPHGKFRPLGGFLRRLYLGKIQANEIEAELRAQYERFCDLLGRPPSVVNAHHHVQIFQPVGAILAGVLERRLPRPYVRCVREPWSTLLKVPGGRAKRAFLSMLGARAARQMLGAGFPGNDWLAGVTDPQWVTDADFMTRWLRRTPGDVVELTCHPGYYDATLAGRDCASGDAQDLRRGRELLLLQAPAFREACAAAGFTLVAPSEWLHACCRGGLHAA
jgi:chitin disaccharide deacetylase